MTNTVSVSKRTDRSVVRAGFTLIELLVVISIISLLVAILLPVLGRARESARDVQCLAQHRMIGVAAYTYASDYKQALPDSTSQGWGWAAFGHASAGNTYYGNNGSVYRGLDAWNGSNGTQSLVNAREPYGFGVLLFEGYVQRCDAGPDDARHGRFACAEPRRQRYPQPDRKL